ncbi:MAG TPA: hypothetical protein VFD98_17100 [Terracidiphilus sp.]|nr:hypothetical protein [Terracidiphilus sp.]
MPVFTRTMVIALIAMAFSSIHALAQDTVALNNTPERVLIRLLESDKKDGEWVFYTQRFLDADNKWAQYRGSVYATVKDIKISDCRIEFGARIVDRFIGLVGKSATGEQQDSSSYSISFTLTRSIADALEMIEARPIQLRKTTHTTCDEKPSCALTWLRIRAKSSEITETVVTNDLLEFRGTTALALLPLSSSELGVKVIQQLRTLSGSRCR